MSGIYKRCALVFVVILAVSNSANADNNLGVDQDEIIDEGLESTVLDGSLEGEVGVVAKFLQDISPALGLKSATASDTFPNVVSSVKTVVNASDQVGEDDDNHDHAFATSFFVTTMSELGDKTFFMSAILAMHHSRTLTFIGATIGQTIMTLVAVIFGMAASLIPQFYTQWASAIIMTFFGVKMLNDGSKMDDSPDGKSNPLRAQHDQLKTNETTRANDETERDEKSAQLKDENDNEEGVDVENKGSKQKRNGIVAKKTNGNEKPADYTKGVLLQAMTLCLMGEWGDKSQIATILLASNEDPYVVAAGGILGHVLCNAVAVFGGRMLASKFPAKIVTQMGGIFFLLAAVSSFVFS